MKTENGKVKTENGELGGTKKSYDGLGGPRKFGKWWTKIRYVIASDNVRKENVGRKIFKDSQRIGPLWREYACFVAE